MVFEEMNEEWCENFEKSKIKLEFYFKRIRERLLRKVKMIREYR